jgi:hypothetical protein
VREVRELGESAEETPVQMRTLAYSDFGLQSPDVLLHTVTISQVQCATSPREPLASSSDETQLRSRCDLGLFGAGTGPGGTLLLVGLPEPDKPML